MTSSVEQKQSLPYIMYGKRLPYTVASCGELIKRCKAATPLVIYRNDVGLCVLVKERITSFIVA